MMLNDLTSELSIGSDTYSFFPVNQVEGAEKLPFALKVLLENVLRNSKDGKTAKALAEKIVIAGSSGEVGEEIEFMPARVLFQDFTGVPVFVDFAVMREACRDLGGDISKINPRIPCDLVIDHSVIADVAGSPGCEVKNTELEFERNKERYEFLKWAQASFENVRIVPPGQGICHQLNIEEFASVVMHDTDKDDPTKTMVYFDTLVGTDSHTPTANGIGVLGWGVGGIEAEAAALGQPITTLVPKVIGIHLTGKLDDGVQAMDVALTFARMLRERGVVGKFVECFGEGVSNLSAQQRACISNMTPEYGCTCTLFPVDSRTIDFLRMTGRPEEQIALVECYAKAQNFWNTDDTDTRIYSDIIEFDLGQVRASMAGPSRPHDRFDLSDAKIRFDEICDNRGLDNTKHVPVDTGSGVYELTNGALAIAAITSCTTATDPSMMLQAGLMARNALRVGLDVKPWVKTIFAPGSHATELLLKRAGLLDDLNDLGFYTCGFGCMSCIGNSGPLLESMHRASKDIELASVLSGNRNFEGRISPDVSQNYLTTPAHVIAFALAGTMDFDPENDALGYDPDGDPIYLKDIEPDQRELDDLVARYVNADLYIEGAKDLYTGDSNWKSLPSKASDVFDWDPDSTYVRRPPYFDGMSATAEGAEPIEDAVVLAFLNDFITTDHISPAGSIADDSPAAEYLKDKGISEESFNTYGSRRGNHEVMKRGTFANVKLSNSLAAGKLGGYTRDHTDGAITDIFHASEHYADAGSDSIIIAGKMYGSGSSRDWAAKGPYLLGVKAVIAESFERIHRSNLIGMGILPLQFLEGDNAESLGLDGTEKFTIEQISFTDGVPDAEIAIVKATRPDGSETEFETVIRIDTPTEGKYYENGGILQYVLRDLKHTP